MMVMDQEYRDIARRILDHNVVVEAGAGTGKTTLLTDRLLFLILAGGKDGKGLDIARIAAMTFTKKAAGEIKARLSSKLSDLIAVIDGRALPEDRQTRVVDFLMEVKQYFKRTPQQLREAAHNAVSRMDQARIGTIHQFALSLLRAYPLEARVDPEVESDEGEAFDDLFEQEWGRWLEEELGTRPPRSAQWMEVLNLVPLQDVTALARELAGEQAADARFGPSDKMKERLSRLAEDFQHLPLGKPEPGAASKIMEGLPAVSTHLSDLQELIARPPSSFSARPPADLAREKARKWPKPWDGLPGEDVYKDALDLACGVSAFSELLVRRAVELVRPFCDAFRDTYARRGFISFDGQLLKARTLLRDRLDVRQDLKGRFDALLVDEFQDTDPVQGEIVIFLSEEAKGGAKKWEDVRLAPGKLFLVGDPKQSIYRFRGADIRAYERFTQLVITQGGMRCPLQTNFRSHAGLVSPINVVFQSVMKEEKALQPGYLPLHPRPEKNGSGAEPRKPSLELVLVSSPKDAEEKLSAWQVYRTEAKWIAGWISRNCGKPAAGQQEKSAKLAFQDVAILFRSTTALSAYLEALKEAKIPYVVEDRYFYGTQEVIDFVNLLRVLDDPQDMVSLVGLLRSPLVGLDDKDIYNLRAGGELDYSQDLAKSSRLPDVTYYRVKAFYALLRRLRDRVGKDPLGDFMARLLKDSFLLETCAAAYHGEQTLSNLMKLGRLASEMGEKRGATLKEFIQRADRAMDDDAVKEGESPLADDTLSAVRLLTYHKAKGLEYDVVFLPGLSAPSAGGKGKAKIFRQNWDDGTAGLRLPGTKAADLSMFFIEQDEARREDSERVRLLYVAMTRARERLILLGRAEGGDKSAFSSLLAKAGAWPKDGDAPTELFLLEGGSLPVSYVTPESVPVAADMPQPAKHSRVSDAAGLALLWKKRMEARDLQQTRPSFETPTAYLQEPEKLAPSLPGDSVVAGVGVLVGQVCHRVLEEWDYAKVDDLTDRIARAYQVLKQRFPVAYWSPVARESEKVLEEFLASPFAQRLAKCQILGREVPFLHAMEGDKIVRGSIDILFRENGRLWVADYKTDRIPSDQMALHAQRYELQGRAYVGAIEKMVGEKCGFQVIYLRSGEAVEVIK